uniref:Putative secreted protein n=1 Tax=Ixodes ricinus TaxID=34613 RepID=A0A147BRP4_IXORI
MSVLVALFPVVHLALLGTVVCRRKQPLSHAQRAALKLAALAPLAVSAALSRSVRRRRLRHGLGGASLGRQSVGRGSVGCGAVDHCTQVNLLQAVDGLGHHGLRLGGVLDGHPRDGRRLGTASVELGLGNRHRRVGAATGNAGRAPLLLLVVLLLLGAGRGRDVAELARLKPLLLHDDLEFFLGQLEHVQDLFLAARTPGEPSRPTLPSSFGPQLS